MFPLKETRLNTAGKELESSPSTKRQLFKRPGMKVVKKESQEDLKEAVRMAQTSHSKYRFHRNKKVTQS